MHPLSQTLARGRDYHQAGQLAQAELLYRQILAVDPNHAEALHLLGLMAYQVGKLDVAEQYIGRAIQLKADEPAFYSNLGLVYQAAGRLDEAVTSFRQALRLQPAFPGAHSNLGTALNQQGRLEEAAASFRQAVQLEPANALFHFNLGNSLLKQGQLDEASRCYRLALERRPDYPEACNNLGNALLQQARLEEAGQSFQQALQLRPRFAEAANNLGLTRLRQGRVEEARRAFEQALQLQPDFAQAHHNLGNALFELRQLDLAQQHFRQALQLQPDLAEAHHSLGNLLWKLGRTDEAVACYQQALRHRPAYADAHCGLGLARMEQSRLAEAQECFRQALQVQPDFAVAHSNLLIALTYDPTVDANARFAEHCHWGARHGRPAQTLPPPAISRDPHRRLRLGYVSPDFRTHVITRFLTPILRHHDREHFAIACYAEVRAPDAATGQLQALADVWRSTCGLSDAGVAELIRADAIDILVDLAGHTGGNRLAAFGYQPAPVQVTYLGYPNTTGVPAIPYRLTDAVADPPGEPLRSTEELVRLPGPFFCWEPPEETPAVTPLPALASWAITFGSLHHPAKLNAQVLELWARILQAIPSARLLMFRHSLTGSTCERVRRELAARGIAASRLDLRHAPLTSGASHLRIYQEIDVLLDAFPWGGHATTCEALWMGVPVLTLTGKTHAGRLAASVLTPLGLTDWIAATPEEYVALAKERTRDRQQLAGLRAQLRARMSASPLCDGKAFTAGLEAAYRALWQRWCRS